MTDEELRKLEAWANGNVSTLRVKVREKPLAKPKPVAPPKPKPALGPVAKVEPSSAKPEPEVLSTVPTSTSGSLPKPVSEPLKPTRINPFPIEGTVEHPPTAPRDVSNCKDGGRCHKLHIYYGDRIVDAALSGLEFQLKTLGT